ncbi:sensory neuron membrane protein 2 isoform X1 [Bombyx mori]|uniref:Sensory neuron membrane protein 2 n=1 Tax=Bombyx mori TaxID=7091 RepID=A0A8R2QYV8_BOMMO|nr:sensory neuron membrane protein 2 isoform X4 [Bombyx mori]XP_037870753.1 sensory neuron membrane protein 2 isoform X4 [Bombyx mori]XP_037870754.1 sensory neuron membrane protein 2 isoform X4 [Bombyx mori]
MLAKYTKTIFSVSVAFLVVSIVLATWGFPKIIRKQIQKNVQISNTSKMYDKWVKLPMPLDFKIYVFNVTNRDAINQGEKPNLKEIGPYVYKQYREKIILGYGDNDTIKYNLKKTFVFDPVASGDLREDDELTVINFSYMAAIISVQEMMPAAVGMINRALEQFFTNLTDPFQTVKVKDLFFDGLFLNCEGDNTALDVPELFLMGMTLPFQFVTKNLRKYNRSVPLKWLICGKIRAEKPPTMRISKSANGFYFSMFSHMNRTVSGPYEMVRGTENLSDLGHVISYQGKRIMSAWDDQYCGQLNGTDSTIFPPLEDGNIPEKLYTFEPDICRSLFASLVGKDTLFNISTYYYEISDMTLGSKSANPDNKCFCKRNWSVKHDGCLLMGVLNLAPCQGAPAIASLPHFYLGSDELADFFGDGIKPDKEKHNTYVHLDPITGVVIKGVKRLQFNIELRNVPSVPQLKEVPSGLFPLLWIEEGAEIPEWLRKEIMDSHTMLWYVDAARWLVLAVAVVAVLVSATLVARSAALIPWPRNSNSISFILGNSVNTSKVHS